MCSQTTFDDIKELVLDTKWVDRDYERDGRVIDPSILYSVKDNQQPGDGNNILVTAALPYVNNEPHLGNIVGCVLSADVYSRFQRLRGNRTLYISGTDEYGTCTETKAIDENTTPHDICNRYHEIHRQGYRWFGIAFDTFGRTTTEIHRQITQDIFHRQFEGGFFQKGTVEQLQCTVCNRVLADRFAEGTCPSCGYADARGDQCESCGKLLDATDLVNPRCKQDHGSAIHVKSDHLFLRLDILQPNVEQFVHEAVNWGPTSRAIALSWLNEGLKMRCMTRDIKWGIPVPQDGFRDKVFYVWYDAPIGYLSITANYTPKWKDWWTSDKTELVQFMGKDNVPFHAVTFPASLMATGDKYAYVSRMFSTDYLMYGAGKFSKSRGEGVFVSHAENSGIDADIWRFYLNLVRPETGDSTFSWSDFATRVKSELLGKVGNLIHRVLSFVAARMDFTIPGATLLEADHALIEVINVTIGKYIEAMESGRLRTGLMDALAFSVLVNKYLTDQLIGTKLLEHSRERCETVVCVALNAIYTLSAMIEPFVPTIAAKFRRITGLPHRMITDTFELVIVPGSRIGKPEILVRELSKSAIEEMQTKCGTTEAI